jgi:hypothetical protein
MGCYKLTYEYEKPLLFLNGQGEKNYSPEWRVWVNPNVSFSGVDGADSSASGSGLQYDANLNNLIGAAGGVAGAFETGAAVGTLQSLRTISFSGAKAGLQFTKVLGHVGTGIAVAGSGYEIVTGHDNTHTWVDLTVTGGSIIVGAVVGTAALPALAVVGLGYGIWSLAGGSDWIDNNWGYRDNVTGNLK